MNTTSTARKQFCKVYIAMPNNWNNRSNAMKRALGAIQRANPHLAILGVNEPCQAHAHYFIDTGSPNWVLKKHRELNLETIPLNQGVDTNLDFTILREKREAAKQADFEYQKAKSKFEEPAK